jgi:hypothetical protein
MSLSKFNSNGRWAPYNLATRVSIKQTLYDYYQKIDLSNMEFEIPYNEDPELSDSWLTITLYHPNGTTYAHSKDKRQVYSK